jgi:hypothetical protein
VELLRAVERGEDNAVSVLSDWLKDRGDPRAAAIRESSEVWERLGLTTAQSNSLKQYLGINPMGLAASVEEIARRAGKKVQTIRNRIQLALHRLSSPTR